jgi:hypothetical protein
VTTGDVGGVLTALRGGMSADTLSARRIAGTLEQPGCARRQLLDAAAVPIDALAQLLGCPPSGQSPFAISRGKAFEARVFDNGMAELIALVREHLNHDLTAVDQVDLSAEQLAEAYGRVDNHMRVAESRRYLRAMLADDPSSRQLLRHPMTSLDVGGIAAYLEADALSFIIGGQLTTVEVKSFAAIDGLPDPAKSAAALSQAAVYIVSLQDTVADLGFDPRRVSTRELLVLTRDFGLTPVGFVRDIAPTVRRLRRRLAGLPATMAIAAGLAAGLELPALPSKNAPLLERQTASRKAADVVSAIPCRFGDGCISCPLFRYCRDEARTADEVTAVGSSVAEACGDVGTVRRALSLARDGATPATPTESAVATHLGRAAAITRRLAAGAPVQSASSRASA